MNDIAFHDMVASRLDAIDGNLLTIQKVLGELMAQQHMPGNCGLTERVRGLELKEAKQAGIFAVVGVIAGLVASGVMAVLLKLLPGR